MTQNHMQNSSCHIMGIFQLWAINVNLPLDTENSVKVLWLTKCN